MCETLLYFDWIVFACLKTWFTKFVKVNKKLLWILSLQKLSNEDFRINYVPEIENGCHVWEQALCRYYLDHLISSNADKRRYT